MLQQEDIQRLFYIQDSTSSVEQVVVGVLDSSGSMSSYWKYLAANYNIMKQNIKCQTITFSSQAQLFGEGNISDGINAHGGGSTNIIAGFNSLNQLLQKYTKQNITVVFVSDGADDNSMTLKDRIYKLQGYIPEVKSLNFICIGVGKGFPTFMSLALRELYHTGDQSVPPLYMVNVQDNEPEGVKRTDYLNALFSEVFVDISNQLNHRTKLLTSPIRLFPWSTENSTESWSGTWVLASETKIQAGDKFLDYIEPTVIQTAEITRFWLQNLQLKALKSNVQTEATKALQFVQRIAIQGRIIKKKLTFAERIAQNSYEGPLLELIKELKQLSEANFLNKLSEAEAAQRLAIGTQVGKYHNKAVQIKGVTVEDYQKDRDEFIEILKKTQLEQNDTERSVISLQNQKEIFLEDDFIVGLKACPSQYDLVTSLPVIGYGLLVKRFDGSMINPWILNVKKLAIHHKYIDTLSIYQDPSNVVKLQTGDGDLEELNCVLPLYTEKDKDLSPLLQSRLFHLLMTFNVMQNVDTCFDTAYAALLSNTFLFLINQPQSLWRDELNQLIEQTYNITYFNKYKFYAKKLQENPALAVVTEHPEVETKCEDVCKPLLILHTLHLSKEEIKPILDRIVIEAISRGIEQEFDQFYKLVNFDPQEVEAQFNTEVDQIIKNSPDDLLNAFYTCQEVLNYVDSKYQEIKFDFKCKAEFDNEAPAKKLQGKYNYQTLQNIYQFYLGEALPQELIIKAIGHSRQKNSYERAKTELASIPELEIAARYELVKDVKNSNKIVEKASAVLSAKYTQQMVEIHRTGRVMPMNALKQHVKDAQLRLTVSDLVANACLCATCPYFLKLNPSYSGHASVLQNIPGFHKTIKANLQKTPEEIFELVKSGACLNAINNIKPVIDQDKMIKDKNYILQEIQEAIKLYKQ